MPPQDCRSRGDCGLPVKTARPVARCRLKIPRSRSNLRGLNPVVWVWAKDLLRLEIAAVAATAA